MKSFQNAINGKGSDETYIDYIMSEKFGLDWKNYENQRMSDFLLILSIESELKNKRNKNGTNATRT